MNPRFYWIAGVVVVVGLVGMFIFWMRKPTVAPVVNNTNTVTNANQTNTNPVNINTAPITDTAFFTTNDLPDRDPAFNFSARLPRPWVAEYVSSSQAINLFQPTAPGDSSLEQSQVFIKYFQASEFQTLTTVDIKSRTETTINGRPAVTYVIHKKSSVPDFPNQPSWRNQEHRVTDIRSTDASPSVYYVFAKSPNLDSGLFDEFLQTVSFSSVGQE